jgi:RNA recognition motif-containing protein
MPNKIYIGNLPFSIVEDDLIDLLSSIGTVTNVHIPLDKDSGNTRGFAFITLDSENSALDAISRLNGVNLGGRNIKISMAVERNDRPLPSQANTPVPPSISAKVFGSGYCTTCNTDHDILYAIEGSDIPLCSTCISALYKASRPREGSNSNQYRDRGPAVYPEYNESKRW